LAGDNPFSVANVDPTNPFGTVDITMAGPNAESMQAWANTLEPGLKTEITQRCDVIAANAATYPADAVGFCTTWSTVQAEEEAVPLPGGAPNILPAPVPNAGGPAPGGPAPGGPAPGAM
jgi:hypothetical protein